MSEFTPAGAHSMTAAGSGIGLVVAESPLPLFNLPLTELWPVVDVRSAVAYDAGHVSGAVRLNMEGVTLESAIEALCVELGDMDLRWAAREKMVVCSETREDAIPVLQYIQQHGLPFPQDGAVLLSVKPKMILHIFGQELAAFGAIHPFLMSAGPNPYHEGTEILQLYLPSQIATWGFYLGAQVQAQNERLLELLGVTLVINLTPEIPNYFESKGKLRYLKIETEDDEAQVMFEAWEACMAAVVAEHAAGGKVLVHCHAGRSRSASCVLYCLIKGGGVGLDRALRFVQSCRSIVEPNAGFMDQLKAVAVGESCLDAFKESCCQK